LSSEAIAFAALFVGVYLLDYVPGVMDRNGRVATT